MDGPQVPYDPAGRRRPEHSQLIDDNDDSKPFSNPNPNQKRTSKRRGKSRQRSEQKREEAKEASQAPMTAGCFEARQRSEAPSRQNAAYIERQGEGDRV